MQYDPTKTIAGLQEILAAVYGERRLISDMLVSAGLSEANISTLKKDALFEFCQNIKFAFACRFLHFQGGYRLHDILLRRYGLFRNETETLEVIGKSHGITHERVRQLAAKAIKRLKAGVRTDAVKILLVLAACKTLGLNEIEFLQDSMLDEPLDDANDAKTQPGYIDEQFAKPTTSPGRMGEQFAERTTSPDEPPNNPKPDMPQSEFYIQGSFDYGVRLGGYELLMVFGEHKKHIEKSGLAGSSDVSMILEAVITGLEILKKPCEVMVFSNTLFGLKNLYNKTGLRDSIKESAANYELKLRLLAMLKEQGHILDNLVESDMRRIIKDLRE